MKAPQNWVALLQEHLRAGRAQEALALAQARLEDSSTDRTALDAFVRLAVQLREPARAVPALVRAASALTHDEVFQTQVVSVLQSLGARDDALAILKRIAEATDRFAPQVQAGNAAFALGVFADAAYFYERAVRAQPEHADAHYNLGVAYRRLGKAEAALPALTAALTANPQHVDALSERAGLWRAQGERALARADLERALGLAPTQFNVVFNLATLEEQEGHLERALDLMVQADALAPERGEVLSLLLQLQREAADWPPTEAQTARLRALIGQGRTSGISPFPLLLGDFNASEQQSVASAWCRTRYGSPAPVVRPRAPASARLRVGYASSDFSAHATTYLLTQLLELHDRSRFEILAYSWAPDDGSPERARIVQACDHFVEIGALSDEAAAQRIASDGIDLLVDLKGLTNLARPGIFLRRPAPVQVNYLGYPGTMGHPAWDAVIADAVVLPPALAAHFTETVVRLPVCYQCNDNTRAIDVTPTREQAGLPAQGFVFGSFNQIAKVGPALFARWMQILVAVPDSVLWLLAPHPLAQDHLRKAAQHHGIAATRLIFAPRLPQSAHLARLRLMDLALDTLPCNSHTTASDALWAGVPLLTCIGDTFAGRVAASLLTHCGLAELVTSSLADYTARAVSIASVPAAHAALRQQLANPASLPIFDATQTARALESAYLALHQAHLAKGQG
jgi:protein O-GlcNAc transferase